MAKSTGPRTPRGKARSSQNAGKHWLQSGRILPGEEDEAAILRNGIAEEFNPQGLIEQEIVDDLTLNRLMKRRCDKAVSREFSKASIEKTLKLEENHQRSAVQYLLRVANIWTINGTNSQQAPRLRPDACIECLEGLKSRITDRGPQPHDFKYLRQIYGDQPTEHAALAMRELGSIATQPTAQDGSSNTAENQDLKKEILEYLTTEIQLQREREKLEDEVFAIESAPEPQEPSGTMLDTLQRYRSATIREFKDLISCLESVRRLKRDAN